MLNNMCRYQKNYGAAFFPLVWNFDHENFSFSHLVIQGKKIQYLDISLLAAGPLISYSALKIRTVSNIKNPQERNTPFWLVCSTPMRRGLWAPCDPSYQEDPKSRPYVARILGNLRYSDYGLRLRINMLLRMIKTT